jgi:hypothetical protein
MRLCLDTSQQLTFDKSACIVLRSLCSPTGILSFRLGDFIMGSRVSVSFDSPRARSVGRIAGIAGIICSLLLFTGLVTAVVRGGNPTFPAKRLGIVSNNWLVTLFKLHFGVDGITSGMLRGVSPIYVAVLLLTAAVAIGLWLVLKRTTMGWSVVGMVLPALGLILFFATQLSGRSAVMATVLVFALITLWSPGFGRIAPPIGIIAAVLLLVGDFTEPLHSKVIACFLAVGYALLVAWYLFIGIKLVRGR